MPIGTVRLFLDRVPKLPPMQDANRVREISKMGWAADLIVSTGRWAIVSYS